MKKASIKQHLIDETNRRINEYHNIIKRYQEDYNDTGDDVFSIEERSQQAQEAETANRAEEQLHMAERTLQQIEKLPLSEKNKVSFGAIVDVDQHSFVIGVYLPSCVIDDRTYLGLSEQAPIFNSIQGLEVGESYTFNGIIKKIDKIQ